VRGCRGVITLPSSSMSSDRYSASYRGRGGDRRHSGPYNSSFHHPSPIDTRDFGTYRGPGRGRPVGRGSGRWLTSFSSERASGTCAGFPRSRGARNFITAPVRSRGPSGDDFPINAKYYGNCEVRPALRTGANGPNKPRGFYHSSSASTPFS